MLFFEIWVILFFLFLFFYVLGSAESIASAMARILPD